LKIAIDLRALGNDNRGRGIGIYSLNLIEALAQIDHKNEYTLIVGSRQLDIELPQHHSILRVAHYHHPLVDRLMNRLMTLPKLSRQGWDVFLQPDPSYGLPARGSRTVCVVYDFIEQDYPLPPPTGLKSRIGYWLRKQSISSKFKNIQKADGLVAISTYTKQQLVKRFPTTADKPTTAIPLGVKSGYATDGHKPAAVPTKPYFLYVGGADARKNLPALITAYNQLRQTHDAALVLVGSDFTNEQIREQADLRRMIADSPYTRDIMKTGFLPEAEVIWLYQHAAGLTFPSLAEGFGLELVEAMAAGCPVICFNNTALTEVAHDAALLVNDAATMSTAMVSLLTDGNDRQQLIKKGRARAAAFTWAKTATATLVFLEEVADEKNPR